MTLLNMSKTINTFDLSNLQYIVDDDHGVQYY